MKALVYTADHETTYRDEPEPQLRPGDALLKVDAVGICGSDMHAWHGHDPRRIPPMILGHEAAGTVLEGKTPGAKVAVNPLIPCGACPPCRDGRTNLCPNRQMIGMQYAGAFADLLAVPESNLIPVPDGMNPVFAALTEPCATGWHAVALAARVAWRPMPELEILVIGGGSVGLLSALITRHYGCASVRLAETNPLRRKTARAAGIDAFDPISDPAVPASFDIVLDCVGTVPTRAAAIGAVKPGGVISHVGLQDWAGEFDARTLTLSEITFQGVYCYTDSDLRASIAALHAGFLGDLAWAEPRPMADGAEAFHDLDQSRTPAAKIVLMPRG